MQRSTTLAAAALAAVVVLAGCGTGHGTGSTTDAGATSSASPSTAPSTASTPPATTPATTTPTTTAPSGTPTPSSTASPTTTATPAPTKPDDGILRAGDKGARVEAAQQRLAALGYWLGTPDGSFGTNTQQAVYALQKAAGLSRDGAIGPQTQKALDRGVRPTPRTHSGNAVDVDLTRQLLMVVEGGKLKYTFNTSTGSGRPYTSDGHTYVAHTPTGSFSVQRQIDGMRTSRLGQLWRPKYFTGGYAFHGSGSVPPYPASHGCARLTNAAIDFVWSSGSAPIGRAVLVYT